METVILLLPTIFCYVTGLIIGWSGYALFNYFTLLHNNATIDNTDITKIAVMIIMTFLSFLSLFAFPHFFSMVYDISLLAEMWYMIFLSCVTYDTEVRLGTVPRSNSFVTTQLKRTNEKVHFHARRHPTLH